MKYETIPTLAIVSDWTPKIHKVKPDRSHTARAAVPKLGVVTIHNIMYVATPCHELCCTVCIVAPVKYETIPWLVWDGIPNIHKVTSDRSHTARAALPKLGVVTINDSVYVATPVVTLTNSMYVATPCHER